MPTDSDRKEAERLWDMINMHQPGKWQVEMIELCLFRIRKEQMIRDLMLANHEHLANGTCCGGTIADAIRTAFDEPKMPLDKQE